MKYNEDKIIKEISDYISNTYTEHYSTDQRWFPSYGYVKTTWY